MNKFIILIMLFCTYQLFALELTQAEIAWIAEHPVIRLGIGKTWAPFIYPKANGKHEGFGIDLINLINKRTGLKVEIVPGNWNELVLKAQSKEIDGLAESAASESRREFFNFSESYLTQYYALATTPKKINTIQSEDKLQGKTLALIKGNIWLNNLVKSLGNVKTIETNTEIEAFNMVVEGKADASFLLLGMFAEYRKTFFDNIVIAQIFNDDKYKLELLYSIRNDWPELITILDKALNDISFEEKTDLYKKWFGFSADAFESQTWLQLTEAEKAWLKEHHVIRIAPDPDFPPIEWFDEENNYKGITADFMELIADALDIEFEVVQCKSWDEVLKKAQSREIDMLPAAAQTPDRAEYMLFSDPHLIFQGVIITTKNNQDLNSTERLYGKKVGIVSGYVWNEFISKGHPEINIINVANIVEGLRKVSTGEIDAFIGTLPIALYYIEKEGIPNLVIAGETEYETKLSIQTRKDWPILNSIMAKTLKAIPPQKKKEIINRWISLKPMSVTSYKGFWIAVLSIFGTGFIIVIIVLAWNKSLKKKVATKTEELEKDIEIRKQVEEELKKSEENFRKQADFLDVVIDNSPFAMWISDAKGMLIKANQALLEILNVTNDMIIGKYNVRYDENIEAQGFKSEVEAVFNDLKSTRFTMFWTGKKVNFINVSAAKEVWIDVSIFPIIDKAGKLLNVVCQFVNITEQKNAENSLKESEEKLRVIFDQSPIAKEIYDANGLLIDVNSRALKLFGITDKKNVLGFNLWDDPNISGSDKEAIRNGNPIFYTSVFDFDIVKKNDLYQTTRTGKIYLELFGVPIIINNTIEGYLIQINEVTDRIKAEQSLEEYKMNLENLVKERTKELEEKNAKLENFNKLFVDREFRIKELKDRIKELEEN